MMATLPGWIVNIYCRGGFHDREAFASEADARDAARLARQLEFVIDVEIFPPGHAEAYCRPGMFACASHRRQREL